MKNKPSIKTHFRFLMFLLLTMPHTLLAQKATLANDTIYKDAKPYALLITSGDWLTGETYSLRTLKNVEVAVANSDPSVPKNSATGSGYNRITFLGSGQIAHYPASLTFEKSFAQKVVENDLISGDSINPQGERRFIALYPSRVQQQSNVIINVGTASNYETVERNRNMPVTVMNGAIQQAGVVIGSCTTRKHTASGNINTVITFSLANGTKCAEATFTGATNNTCSIVTFKDNKTHSFTVKFSSNKEQEVAEFLAKNYYL